MVSIAGGNNPFAGGAQQRNLPPPAVGGADLSANTRVSAPVGGVNPGQIFSARNNEGSNIGIPYTRLTPLNNEMPLGKRSFDGSRKEMHTETQSLRATTLAFILGKRSKLPAIRADPVDGDRSQLHMMHTLMPGMPGTERFQALCSLEYLQLYFEQVCAKLQIVLNEPLSTVLDKPGRVLGCPNGAPTLEDTDTFLNVRDYATEANVTQPGSEMEKSSERLQGIYAHDVGPFLRGKGIAQAMLQTTTSSTTMVSDGAGNDWAPCLRSRNSGDEMAFAALLKKMTDIGLLDWTPDGIVLSKGAEDPSDKLSDEYFSARDGQLFNIRVQGPAVGTTWTGDSSMETLPLDKVFVVIVADVWFDLAGEDQKVVDAFRDGTAPTAKEGEKQKTAAQAYEELRQNKILKLSVDSNAKEMEFLEVGFEAFKGKAQNTVLTNFRIELTTSSQIVNYSHMRHSAVSKTVPGKRSRMGLHLTQSFGEYIVGGWSIGNVMDTSASRATMPNAGSSIGVRTAPNSAALNINVSIGYWDGDRFWRTFMNKEGSVKPRYESSQGGPQLPMNVAMPKTEVEAASIEFKGVGKKRAKRDERQAAAAAVAGGPRADDAGAFEDGPPSLVPGDINASAAGAPARAAAVAAARAAGSSSARR